MLFVSVEVELSALVELVAATEAYEMLVFTLGATEIGLEVTEDAKDWLGWFGFGRELGLGGHRRFLSRMRAGHFE